MTLQVTEWAPIPKECHAELLELLRPAAEAWSGHDLEPVYLFGTRRYTRGAALVDHIDDDLPGRAIGLSVTVDVEGLAAPWPLVAHGGVGAAGAAELPVGYCFVYEAARVRHGRPKPLMGSVFANAFAHYTLRSWGPRRPGDVPNPGMKR